MIEQEETIFIIDDDPSVRKSLALFLKSYNYTVETFPGSEEFLSREPFEGTGCIILDVNLGGKTGLELQEVLISLDSHLPIVFISGQGNIPMSVNVLKKGAVNFLEKPFKDEELLRSIEEALELSRRLKAEKEEIRIAQDLVNTLTPREKEILAYLNTGMLNKQIAGELGIAEQTVKLHRQSICHKLCVKSVPEILRMADKAGITK